MNVVGLNSYEFDDKETKETIEMFEMHLTDDSNVDVNGIAVCKFNITGKKLGNYRPQLGDEIIPVRNEKGRIITVYPIATVSEPVHASYGNTQ